MCHVKVNRKKFTPSAGRDKGADDDDDAVCFLPCKLHLFLSANCVKIVTLSSDRK